MLTHPSERAIAKVLELDVIGLTAPTDLVTFVAYDAIGNSVMTNLTVIASSKAILDLPAMSGSNQVPRSRVWHGS